MSKPLLSIGIIFKNEIRCLERCLKSLQPLRDAVSCELVMADTGSDDGSRQVAERYADILFDFPWINDFAAARNAVMDRSSGEWYFTVDADEWLDEDISQLTRFLANPGKKTACTVVQRNYTAFNSQERFSDFFALRMVRMSTCVRYRGAIHEVWPMTTSAAVILDKTILHHDGYVGLAGDKGKEKRKRNMELLREELKKTPNSLLRRLQCVESSAGDPEQEHYIRLAVDGVKEKLPGWDRLGPVIFRSAVMWMADHSKEELGSFVEEARVWFPNSISIRLDVEFIACSASWQKKDYEKAISAGEAYMRALADYRARRCDVSDLLYSSIISTSPLMENQAKLMLMESHYQVHDYQKSADYLATLEFDRLGRRDFNVCVGIMLNLQAQSGLELSGQMERLWNCMESLDEANPVAKRWKGTLASVGGKVFPPSYRDGETTHGFRHAYTLFLPLAGTFELGTAAQILETTDPGELERLLGEVRDWKELPIHALTHAIRCGARFPLPDKPLNVEEMNGFASRLAQDMDGLYQLVEQSMERGLSDHIREFIWTRGLVLAAVQKFGWRDKTVKVEQGMTLMYAFVEVERKYLPLCYTSEIMQEKNLFLLPATHRLGFYCVRAFDALERGDTVEYVRLLRAGLVVCETASGMVEFLLEHTPELQTQPEPSAELLAIAEQIRMVLSNFAPDDPAVVAIKQSEAYRKVADLIEGASVPVAGGLLQ